MKSKVGDDKIDSAIHGFRVALICSLAATCGCSSFAPARSTPSGIDAAAAPTNSAPASCTVVLRKTGSTPREMEVPLPNVTRLQEVLEQTGVTKKIRHMELYVLRAVPGDPQQRHKMAAHYNSGRRQVSMETDYAIYPGDRIVVIEEASTQLEQMLAGAVGPLDRLIRR